jgi:hypothetical protein
MVDMTYDAVAGPQSNQDNQLALLRLGNSGEQIMQQLYGNYAELTRRGLVYVARSAAVAAIPINTTLTNSPTLWNTASSGKLVYPLAITVSPGAIGTPVLHGLTLSYLTNAGDAALAAAPVATFTNVVPLPCLIGRGACQTKFAHAVCTFTVNPAAFADLGLGHWLEGTAATGLEHQMFIDLKGLIVMPPGTTLSVGATAATSSTYSVSIFFAEVPLPPLWS